MKYYVQFLDLNMANKVVEALGTDGIFILDGRNSLELMEEDAIIHFCKMNKNLHNYCGWRIMKGERFDDSIIVKEWIDPESKQTGLL